MSLIRAKEHFARVGELLTEANSAYKAGVAELNKLKVAAPASTGATVPTATRVDVPQPKPAPPRRPNTGVTLPKLETQGPKELSEETRAKSVEDGLEIAQRAAAVVGADSQHYMEALRGGLALAHIPFDAEVLKRLRTLVQ